jgi:hypothetical protein
MSNQSVYKALDILREHPEITTYIKSFEGRGGFMYTQEKDPKRIALKHQMEELLDDGSHSGASWGCMMRTIQAVLNGIVTIEELKEEDKRSNERYEAYLREIAQETAQEQTRAKVQ